MYIPTIRVHFNLVKHKATNYNGFMELIEEIIERNSGYSELGRKLELGVHGRQRVYEWRLKKNIPENHVLKMLLMGIINNDEAWKLSKKS